MIEKLNDIIKVDDNGNIVSNQWIEWYHFGVSSKVGVSREKERKVLKRLNHCETCTNLSGCYFVERNMPSLPLHPHCDCKKLHITYDKVNAKAKAWCDIKKFTEYVFTNKGLLNGKSELFDLLGYTIKDSDYLQGLLCVKALEQYKLCDVNFRFTQIYIC